MNPKERFPIGGARPLNGGYNTGGGIITLSSFDLDRYLNFPFQSTLQHELGHGFGLCHPDVYGYSMQSSDSIMSYNPKHDTKGFLSSQTPGQLTTMDLYGLSLNQRAFPGLRFEPKKDDPPLATIMERLVCLGPMTIPGQPDGVKVTTDSGEEFGSKVSNVVQGRIRPSEKTGKVTFDRNTMWHSSKSPTGWVSLQLTFPYDVELTRIAIHSEHSGQYNAAHAARLLVQDANQKYRTVVEKDSMSPNDTVTLPRTKGRTWQLDLQAGESKSVTLRGLQFFCEDEEMFPPLVPCQP